MSASAQQPLVLAAQIVTSYLEAHSVDTIAVPGLIRDIYETLESLSHNGQQEPRRLAQDSGLP
jgi:predicted transcriptional regulator